MWHSGKDTVHKTAAMHTAGQGVHLVIFYWRSWEGLNTTGIFCFDSPESEYSIALFLQACNICLKSCSLQESISADQMVGFFLYSME